MQPVLHQHRHAAINHDDGVGIGFGHRLHEFILVAGHLETGHVRPFRFQRGRVANTDNRHVRLSGDFHRFIDGGFGSPVGRIPPAEVHHGIAANLVVLDLEIIRLSGCHRHLA